jgi:hypothetical protein
MSRVGALDLLRDGPGGHRRDRRNEAWRRVSSRRLPRCLAEKLVGEAGGIEAIRPGRYRRGRPHFFVGGVSGRGASRRALECAPIEWGRRSGWKSGTGRWPGCNPAPFAEHFASSGYAICPNQNLAASVADRCPIVAIPAHPKNAGDQEKRDADKKREAAPGPPSTPGDQAWIPAAGRFSPWRVRHQNQSTSDRALQADRRAHRHPPQLPPGGPEPPIQLVSSFTDQSVKIHRRESSARLASLTDPLQGVGLLIGVFVQDLVIRLPIGRGPTIFVEKVVGFR